MVWEKGSVNAATVSIFLQDSRALKKMSLLEMICTRLRTLNADGKKLHFWEGANLRFKGNKIDDTSLLMLYLSPRKVGIILRNQETMREMHWPHFFEFHYHWEDNRKELRILYSRKQLEVYHIVTQNKL